MDKEKLVEAIVNYDEDTVRAYIEKRLIDSNDENLLELAIVHRNIMAFDLLIHEINVTDRSRLFFKCVSTYLPIALNLIENSEFQKETHMKEYSNYNSMNMFFPNESILPNYFKPITFNNNKEAFLADILSRSVTSNQSGPDDFLVFSYLIEHRKEFKITDEQVIKYVVENNYELEGWENNFVNIVNKLIDKNVDLSIDKNGYLIQIAAYNNLPELLVSLHENGSNLIEFFERYNNQLNWLSAEGHQELIDKTDYYNERTYNIYKKFDDKNKLSEKVLSCINIILNHKELNNDLAPNNGATRSTKLKM